MRRPTAHLVKSPGPQLANDATRGKSILPHRLTQRKRQKKCQYPTLGFPAPVRILWCLTSGNQQQCRPVAPELTATSYA